MGNSYKAKKETKNAFLRMSLKKAPVHKDENDTEYGISDSALKEAQYINQVVHKDKWQG